jgi:hypothetical protein
MFTHWKPKLVAAGGFLLAVINWLLFFGVDAKTIREQMTAHYLFLISPSFAPGFSWVEFTTGGRATVLRRKTSMLGSERGSIRSV